MGATVDGFAGPGGWDEGARILGLDLDMVGIEIDEQACAAAVSAGHQRIRADIRDIDPAQLNGVTGAILSSPCPTWTRAGLRDGHRNMQVLLDLITHAGSGCGCSWEEIEAEIGEDVDPRTSLAAQVIRFALLLPDLEWLAVEQVPTVEIMFEDIAAELLACGDDPDEAGYGPGWEAADVFTLDAQHVGMPVRRERTFLVARRYTPLGGPGVAYPGCPPKLPAPTMAQALGWPTGHQIRTRGNRKATGGNLFSADGPSWCLTEKARSWERNADGLRLTPAEAGLLQGFRRDYPWSGSRTRQFHQLADVVVPPVAAAVLGYATETPWDGPVRAYLEELYGEVAAIAPPEDGPGQLALFPAA